MPWLDVGPVAHGDLLFDKGNLEVYSKVAYDFLKNYNLIFCCANTSFIGCTSKVKLQPRTLVKLHLI